VVVVY